MTVKKKNVNRSNRETQNFLNILCSTFLRIYSGATSIFNLIEKAVSVINNEYSNLLGVIKI